MNIPCDRCLESVLTRVNFDIDFEEDLKELSGRIEEQEEKDYIDGYNLDVDRLVFGEFTRYPCREEPRAVMTAKACALYAA